MNEYKLNLLERISSGQRKFEAAGLTLKDCEEFLPLARALQELEDDGMLIIKGRRKESRTGRRMYYLFIVERLTEAGKAALGKDDEDDL
jgi:hypothetical protein